MNRTEIQEFNTLYNPDRCSSLINAVNSQELEMRGLKRQNYPGLHLPKDILPGVLSIGYWNAKANQSWGLDWHRNEGIEFTFLETGSLNFSTEKGSYNLAPGAFTITKPWELHKVGAPNVTVGKLHWLIIDVQVRHPHQPWIWPEWVILSKPDLEYLTKVLRQNDVQVWKTEKKIQQCFRELGFCLDSCGTEIPHSKLNLLLNSLLLEMLLQFKNGKVDLDESLTMNLRTVEIFLKNLRNDYEKFWSLDDMAIYCGIGKSSFSKYCKQLTNMTPIEYLNNIRLDAAADRLQNYSGKNISDISYCCGFSTAQYFATVFKNRFKCTPSEYAILQQCR